MATDTTPINKKTELSSIGKTLAQHPALYAFFLVFIIAAGAFFVLIVPAVRSLQSGGSSSLSDLNIKITDAQARFDYENKIVTAITSLSDADRARIKYALPSEPDTLGLLLQIAAIVKSAGSMVPSIDFSLASDTAVEELGGNVGAVETSINVSGMDYEKFKILLNAIQNNLRIIDIKNFVFSATGDSVSLNLRTYYQK